MKKILILFVVLFGLIIMTNETKAECPAEFSQDTTTIMVNGCAYLVEICYRCATTAPPQIYYLNAFTKIDSACVQTWSIDSVFREIMRMTVKNLNFKISHLCPIVPPCTIPPTGLLEWFNEARCWHKIRLDSTSIRYEACPNTDTCKSLWRICWDPVEGHAVETLLIGPYWVYNSPCPPGNPDEYPINIGDTTACFILPTSCDP